MNTVSVRAMEKLTRHLIRTAVDTVTRAHADPAESAAPEGEPV
jgi:hypothetical protein